jgi:poly-gamma-glutamate synthesis protein (capsule biosynthesis protein)
MKLALAGDTMLGRKVGERLGEVPRQALFADEVVAATREADLFVLNPECAISARGERWPDPDKPCPFRAPPIAVDVLATAAWAA